MIKIFFVKNLILKLLYQNSYIKAFIKNTIINIIINYNYTQHFDVAIDDIPARNLFESFDFEIKFEVMLKNASLKSFRRSRDFEL